MNEKELKAEIAELNAKFTGDFLKDIDLADQIHALEMKLKGVKPADGSCEIGCDSCGA